MPLSPRKESPAILPDIAPKLAAQMPGLRGSLASHAPMAGLSWFRTGGPAQVLFEPAEQNDLSYFLARLDPAIPVLVLGAGSNILVRDGGIEGVVIRLGKGFQEVTIEGLCLRTGAGCLDVKQFQSQVLAQHMERPRLGRIFRRARGQHQKAHLDK